MDQNTIGNTPYQDYAPISMTGEGALLPQNPVVTPTTNDALQTISTKPAVITSTPVVEKAESDMQQLSSLTQQKSDFKSVVEGLASRGEGQIVSTTEGQRYVNAKGDMYDMNGVIIGSSSKDTSGDLTAALGGTSVKPGETEQTTEDGVKLIVDASGKITSGGGKYKTGTNINQYAETSGFSLDTPEDSQEYVDMQNQLDQLMENADSLLASQISSIKGLVNSAKSSQDTANKVAEGQTFNIGITTGRSRYAPDIQTGIYRAQVSAGIKSIMDIEAKGQQLIAEAQAAAEDRKFKILSAKMDAYQKNRSQKFEEVTKTKELAMAWEQHETEKKKSALEQLKLAREEAAANASLYAPSIIEDLSTMSDEDASDYINKTAEESGLFDAVTLKAAIDAYKRDVAAEKNKGISSYMADFNALGGQKGTGQTFQQFYASQQAAERAPETGGGVDFTSITEGGTALTDAAGRLQAKMTAKGAEMFGNLISQQAERGDINAVKETLWTAAIDDLPAADQSAVTGRIVTLDLLDSLKSDLEQYEKDGYDTNIFRGTAEQVAQKLGATTDAKQAALATKINTTIQNYRQSISGAAFTVPETKEYKAIFPSITNVKELNVAKIDALRETYQSVVKTKIGLTMGRQAYEQIFGQEGAWAGASGEKLAPVASSTATDARTKIINAGYDYDAIKRDNPKLTDQEILDSL